MATTEQSSSPQTVNRPSKPHWLVRLLFHPMLYLAVIIHGLVLVIPGGPEDELPPEVEEEQEIEITMLPAIIEPDPEIEVEVPPEEPLPPPPPPLPEPIAPPPEPIQEQEPSLIPELEPEPEPEPENEDEGEMGGEDGDEGGDEGEGEADGEQDGEGERDTFADVGQVADQIAAIVARINQSREPTIQIDSAIAPKFPNQYKQPDNYFADSSVSQDALFAPGIILATSVTGNSIPVNLDDISNADDFVEGELMGVLGETYQVDIVSTQLPQSRGVQVLDDYLLRLSDPNNPDNILFYLAIARMNGGSVTLFPWFPSSFLEEE
ncbi:MAG: hypothetical protein F6K30_03310 [Cyanothece sp. SIO2G6]|nr:hypothetical protein [Cyanothece sp. SIO2G6]